MIKVLAVLAVLWFGCATSAYSCSCVDVSPKKKLRAANAVFIGTVESVQSSKDKLLITFQVQRFWKGVRQPKVVVSTLPPFCCTCGLNAQEGEQYLIYAYGSDGIREVSTCDSMLANSQRALDELRVLGRGKTRRK